eukprot:11226973-Lingulodinium_polyedra.AAC.1
MKGDWRGVPSDPLLAPRIIPSAFARACGWCDQVRVLRGCFFGGRVPPFWDEPPVLVDVELQRWPPIRRHLWKWMDPSVGLVVKDTVVLLDVSSGSRCGCPLP